jgi:hypothetical protein
MFRIPVANSKPAPPTSSSSDSPDAIKAEDFGVDAVAGRCHAALVPQRDNLFVGCGHHTRVKPPVAGRGFQYASQPARVRSDSPRTVRP